MPYLRSVATQTAPYAYQQREIFEYMRNRLVLEPDAGRKMKFLYERSGIEQRTSVLPDFGEDAKEKLLYHRQTVPTVQERMHIFGEKALPLAKEVAVRCLEATERSSITHLIVVSCTGMSAPGLDVQLVRELGLKSTVGRSAVHFMGCYAGVHALKQAWQIAHSQPDALVLVVSVELCTLHFQESDSQDTMLANMLFADGAAAALVSSAPGTGLPTEIKSFYSDILFAGEADMSWNIADTGFLMTLSSYVPQLISADIRAFFEVFLKQEGLQLSDIAHWAIHPGGKAILEGIQAQLGLNKKQLEASWEVMKNCGNMSSATLFFVLERILKTPSASGCVLAAAFGPGLSMESLLLKIH